MSDFTTYIELLRIIEEGKSPNCFDTEIQGSVRMQKASRSFLRVEYHLPLTIFVASSSRLFNSIGRGARVVYSDS